MRQQALLGVRETEESDWLRKTSPGNWLFNRATVKVLSVFMWKYWKTRAASDNV